MSSLDVQKWQTYAHAYAFMGNSLLRPMSQTEVVGLDPTFWEVFPTFDDETVAEALNELTLYAAAITTEEAQAIKNISVEYTYLFVGPPKPAAPPWETMYASKEVTVGFGQATFDMRTLLREAGLAVKNENNQYEDHLGIELLYLSTLCSRAAAREDEAMILDLITFLEKHPLAWIEVFRACVVKSAPGSYYARLLALVQATLTSQRRMLD